MTIASEKGYYEGCMALMMGLALRNNGEQASITKARWRSLPDQGFVSWAWLETALQNISTCRYAATAAWRLRQPTRPRRSAAHESSQDVQGQSQHKRHAALIIPFLRVNCHTRGNIRRLRLPTRPRRSATHILT